MSIRLLKKDITEGPLSTTIESKTDFPASLIFFETWPGSTVPSLDLIILMLGTNDLKARFGVDPYTIAFGFGRYLNAVKTVPMAGNRPEVLLAAPLADWSSVLQGCSALSGYVRRRRG